MGVRQIHCGNKEPESDCNKLIVVDYELTPSEKRCAGECKEYFPATSEFFYSNKARGDGLDARCKECDHIEGNKKYHKKRRSQKMNRAK